MHVGRAGDAFGDTSFLHSKAGSPKASPWMSRPPAPPPSAASCSLRDWALFVKNAMSLPQLNEKEAAENGASKVPKSLSVSLVKKAEGGGGGGGGRPAERGGEPPFPDPLLDEQAFGDLAELPTVPRASLGLKYAESIMSFHIDLGPSMLGDILSVMDKDEWDPDAGEEDGPSGPPRAPPPLAATPRLGGPEDKAAMDQASLPPPAPEDEGWAAAAPPSPSSGRSMGSHTMLDSSSLSSGTSGVLEERSPALRGPDGARAAPPRQPDKEFSFMDEEEEDEIRL